MKKISLLLTVILCFCGCQVRAEEEESFLKPPFLLPRGLYWGMPMKKVEDAVRQVEVQGELVADNRFFSAAITTEGRYNEENRKLYYNDIRFGEYFVEALSFGFTEHDKLINIHYQLICFSHESINSLKDKYDYVKEKIFNTEDFDMDMFWEVDGDLFCGYAGEDFVWRLQAESGAVFDISIHHANKTRKEDIANLYNAGKILGCFQFGMSKTDALKAAEEFFPNLKSDTGYEYLQPVERLSFYSIPAVRNPLRSVWLDFGQDDHLSVIKAEVRFDFPEEAYHYLMLATKRLESVSSSSSFFELPFSLSEYAYTTEDAYISCLSGMSHRWSTSCDTILFSFQSRPPSNITYINTHQILQKCYEMLKK